MHYWQSLSNTYVAFEIFQALTQLYNSYILFVDIFVTNIFITVFYYNKNAGISQYLDFSLVACFSKAVSKLDSFKTMHLKGLFTNF